RAPMPTGSEDRVPRGRARVKPGRRGRAGGTKPSGVSPRALTRTRGQVTVFGLPVPQGVDHSRCQTYRMGPYALSAWPGCRRWRVASERRTVRLRSPEPTRADT